jgi:hypothetical protein
MARSETETKQKPAFGADLNGAHESMQEKSEFAAKILDKSLANP